MTDFRKRIMVEYQGKLVRKDLLKYRDKFTNISISRNLRDEVHQASVDTGISIRELTDMFVAAGLAELADIRAGDVSTEEVKQEVKTSLGLPDNTPPQAGSSSTASKAGIKSPPQLTLGLSNADAAKARVNNVLAAIKAKNNASDDTKGGAQ